MRGNWLEWLALAASALAVVGVVGFLVVDAIIDEGRPPMPEVELLLEEAYPAPEGWLVPATLRNHGDTAAEALVVQAAATVGGEEESSELVVDYLPSGSSVDVAFGFSAEPTSEVAVRIIGFRLP